MPLRIVLIVLTGLLAVLNVLIASAPSDTASLSDFTKGFWRVLPVFAAAYAAAIAVLSSIEGFLKYRDRGQGYRQAREIFLDAHREFTALWLTHVLAFNDSPTACLNASRLYRRISAKDQAIRQMIKQMTEKTETAPKPQ